MSTPFIALLPKFFGDRRLLLPIVVLFFGLCPPALLGGDIKAIAQSELTVRERVADIQRMLADRGFNPGPIDGVLGQATISAIRDYQRSVGLPVTGMATPDLRQQLKGAGQFPQSAPPARPTAQSSEPGSENSVADATQTTPDIDSVADDTVPLSRLGSPDTRPNPLSDSSSESEPADDNPAIGVTTDSGTKQESGNVEAVATDPGKLVGTSWNFIDEGGATFTGRFGEGGSFEGPGDARFWSWHPVPGGILITFDNRLGTSVKREGRIVEDDWLNGSAVASTGKSWSWVAERETTEQEATPALWPPVRR